jgi:hypothetical protein
MSDVQPLERWDGNFSGFKLPGLQQNWESNTLLLGLRLESSTSFPSSAHRAPHPSSPLSPWGVPSSIICIALCISLAWLSLLRQEVHTGVIFSLMVSTSVSKEWVFLVLIKERNGLLQHTSALLSPFFPPVPWRQGNKQVQGAVVLSVMEGTTTKHD